ncbi:MCE family protein [Nocardioides sp. CFH 31398]|uniref:MCE family protein n=1 Tax=Nocardioides sp. CFH 31398 TaxID=2919579 RepID=UPI001F067A5D|nr:MCE family protein [Nocardioides sp. CFH 31398]MCH1865236.1 MCE family protein [Nocardioides sp. CFH 31398]
MNLLKAYKTLGAIFLAMLVGSVYLTYAIFTQRFTDFQNVTLETSKIGLQLPDRADVKLRGMIVGEVRGIDVTDDGAELTLGILPDKIDEIPADVTGSIIPKTLFGQKEVELIPPDGTVDDGPTLEAGDVIDRTVVATEVERVLSDLQPLLTAVRPGDLNMTLNALVVALEGRGDRLGDNIERLNAYLGKLNPELPALMEDLRLTAEVSDVYNDVIPELSTILRNTVTTFTTLEGREDRLQALLGDLSRFADTTRVFLEDNGDNLIRVGQLGEQQLAVLARYSPEYPCLLGGLVNAGADQGEAFRDYTLHINLELLPQQPRAYTPNEVPQLGADNPPFCGELPNPSYSQENRFTNIPDFDDGVNDSTLRRSAPGASVSGAGGDDLAGTGPAPSYVGTSQEAEMLRSMMAPALGTSADEVPDLGVALLGPMARGSEVELR